jgi:hypothetical protein
MSKDLGILWVEYILDRIHLTAIAFQTIIHLLEPTGQGNRNTGNEELRKHPNDLLHHFEPLKITTILEEPSKNHTGN